jgi:hypothetical protein
MLRRGASRSRRRCEAAARPRGRVLRPPHLSLPHFFFPRPPPLLTPTACSRAARGRPLAARPGRRGNPAEGRGLQASRHTLRFCWPCSPLPCDGPVGRAAPSAACAALRVGLGAHRPGTAMCSWPLPHTCMCAFCVCHISPLFPPPPFPLHPPPLAAVNVPLLAPFPTPPGGGQAPDPPPTAAGWCTPRPLFLCLSCRRGCGASLARWRRRRPPSPPPPIPSLPHL